MVEHGLFVGRVGALAVALEETAGLVPVALEEPTGALELPLPLPTEALGVPMTGPVAVPDGATPVPLGAGRPVPVGTGTTAVPEGVVGAVAAGGEASAGKVMVERMVAQDVTVTTE